jgi:hypothetical protein
MGGCLLRFPDSLPSKGHRIPLGIRTRVAKGHKQRVIIRKHYTTVRSLTRPERRVRRRRSEARAQREWLNSTSQEPRRATLSQTTVGRRLTAGPIFPADAPSEPGNFSCTTEAQRHGGYVCNFFRDGSVYPRERAGDPTGLPPHSSTPAKRAVSVISVPSVLRISG